MGIARAAINYKLLAVEVGESLKHDTTVNEVERIGSAVFSFSRVSQQSSGITSVRSQCIYDWILSLAAQPISEAEKGNLLRLFVTKIAPPGHRALALVGIKLAASTSSKPEGWNDLDTRIQKVAETRFGSRNYADAVEAALKEINHRIKVHVKNLSGQELDGSSLMNTAFSLKNPIIVLDDLATEMGKNIQIGYMQIFAGAMTGIRNPKAHQNIHITERRAMQFLVLASLLMEKLDEASCP